MKTTPWFPYNAKPARVGRYEVRNAPGKIGPRHRLGLNVSRFRFWDGIRWRTYEGGPASVMGLHHSHQWRGLAQEPKS